MSRKVFDPFAVKLPTPKAEDRILFACGQRQGAKETQEDAMTHFNDEFFAIADGVGSLPHANVAAGLAVDTAVWAYKVVRTRPFYWGEKPDLIKRIFRTTNLTLWQKRRDAGFEDGLAAAMLVLMVLPTHFWIGSAGNCASYLYREGLIDELTVMDVDSEGMLTKAAGFARPQLLPRAAAGRFLPGDCILIATDGVAGYVSEDEMRLVFEQTGAAQDTMDAALNTLLSFAEKNGSADNMTAYIIKRVAGTIEP